MFVTTQSTAPSKLRRVFEISADDSTPRLKSAAFKEWEQTWQIRHVVEVQISDLELFKALEICGLPRVSDCMTFYGDFAKHILGNW